MKLTCDAMRAEGVEPDCQVIGGGSDANVLAGFGYRSVIIGLGMRNVHTVDETLNIAETMKCTKVMRRIMSAE